MGESHKLSQTWVQPYHSNCSREDFGCGHSHWCINHHSDENGSTSASNQWAAGLNEDSIEEASILLGSNRIRKLIIAATDPFNCIKTKSKRHLWVRIHGSELISHLIPFVSKIRWFYTNELSRFCHVRLIWISGLICLKTYHMYYNGNTYCSGFGCQLPSYIARLSYKLLEWPHWHSIRRRSDRELINRVGD